MSVVRLLGLFMVYIVGPEIFVRTLLAIVPSVSLAVQIIFNVLLGSVMVLSVPALTTGNRFDGVEVLLSAASISDGNVPLHRPNIVLVISIGSNHARVIASIAR